jgi:hypothetical protein
MSFCLPQQAQGPLSELLYGLLADKASSSSVVSSKNELDEMEKNELLQVLILQIAPVYDHR